MSKQEHSWTAFLQDEHSIYCRNPIPNLTATILMLLLELITRVHHVSSVVGYPGLPSPLNRHSSTLLVTNFRVRVRIFVHLDSFETNVCVWKSAKAGWNRGAMPIRCGVPTFELFFTEWAGRSDSSHFSAPSWTAPEKRFHLDSSQTAWKNSEKIWHYQSPYTESREEGYLSESWWKRNKYVDKKGTHILIIRVQICW